MLPSSVWDADALCLEYPDLPWFQKQGQKIDEAKAVCGRCPVRTECLAFALERHIEHGIWGGTSPPERRALAKAGATAELVRESGGAWFLAS